MGELLRFPDGEARERRRPEPDATGERGRILFFTGVRIERAGDEPREPVTDDGSRRPRRRKA